MNHVYHVRTITNCNWAFKENYKNVIINDVIK